MRVFLFINLRRNIVSKSVLFTSESVTEGHPDKISDQISDSVLDAILAKDPMGRVACETLVTTGLVHVVGEITTNCYVDIPKIVRETIREIGYTRAKFGFDGDTCGVMTSIGEQSADIAMGVDKAKEAKDGEMEDSIDAIGAGDQGMMFGYATDETPEYLPLPYVLATRVLEKLMSLGHPLLGKDAKAQVSYDYEKKRIDTFLVSIQHTETADLAKVKRIVTEAMMAVALRYRQNLDFNVLVNPTGRFVLGGSFADAGVTGRKIVADTYGGFAHHGGGAFSGKDPSKVDRSAAYMARKIAKDIVREGYAKRCEVQLAYAIGVAEPVSVHVETFGTSRYTAKQLEGMIRERYDLTPRGIIKELHLLNVDYTKTTCFGHFTKGYLPWEK